MTQAFRDLPRGRVLQYHNVTPATFFAPYDADIFRLAAIGRDELGTLVGHADMALGDSEFNRQELDALGFRTPASSHRHRPDRIRSAPRRPALEQRALRRPAELPVRRPNRAQQEDRGPHQARGALQAVRRHRVSLHLRRQDRRRAALLQHGARADRRIPDAGGSLHLHRTGAGRRSGDLLSDGARLHLALRARRVLRTAPRGHGRGRAGAGVCVDGRARYAGRRGRPVHAEGSRTCRRAARRAGLQR